MTSRRVTGRSVASVRAKSGGPGTVVTKVNRIPGSKRRGVSTFQVITKKRERK